MFELPEAHPIGPEFLIRRFESEAFRQTWPLVDPPTGWDAVREEFIPPELARSLARQGYDPAEYVRRFVAANRSLPPEMDHVDEIRGVAGE